MAATTITLSKETKERLEDYKAGSKTFDEVLNLLMDLVPLDEVSKAHLKEHELRLETYRLDSHGAPRDRARPRPSGPSEKDPRALLGFGPREPGMDDLIRRSREIESEALRRALRRRRSSSAG